AQENLHHHYQAARCRRRQAAQGAHRAHPQQGRAGATGIDPRSRPCAAEGGRDRRQRRRQEVGRRAHRRSLRDGRELTSASRAPYLSQLREFRDIALEGCAVSLVSMPAGVDQAELPQTASKAGSARVLRPALGLLLPVALAVFWEIAVRWGWSSGRLVPPPSVIFQTFADLARTGELELHAAVTLSRVAAGFAFGVAAGTLCGAIAGYSALTHRLVDPTLQALRAIPSIAWVPLFILWFGIFEASKIILIAVGVFFPVYLGVMGAVMSVDRKIVEVGRVF